MLRDLTPLLGIGILAMLIVFYVPVKGAEYYPLCVKGAHSNYPENVTAIGGK